MTIDFPNPFRVETDKAVVALKGARDGYMMIASAKEVFRYEGIPEAVFTAARDWASTLEALGSPRVYWLILSEVTLHYHIHVFPRWEGDSLKGIPLFETREHPGQPEWRESTLQALHEWATGHGVEVL